MPTFTLNGKRQKIADGSSIADVIDTFAPIAENENLFYLISVNGKIAQGRTREIVVQPEDDVKLIPQSYGG